MIMTAVETPPDMRFRDAGHAAAESRGLFEGFEGYCTPTLDDYRRVLTEGLVVPDANVLLTLYRYGVADGPPD
jgi:hypothetical protein